MRSKWEDSGEEWGIPICFVHYKHRLARLTLRRRSDQTFPMRLFPNMLRHDCLVLTAAARLYMSGSALCIRASYKASKTILSTMPGGHSVSSIKEGRARHRVDTRPASMSGWRTICARHTAV